MLSATAIKAVATVSLLTGLSHPATAMAAVATISALAGLIHSFSVPVTATAEVARDTSGEDNQAADPYTNCYREHHHQ